MAKVKVFRNVGQRLQSISKGNRPLCHLKEFHQLSIHVKYEVSVSYGSKIMAKVKGFFHKETYKVTDRQDKN